MGTKVWKAVRRSGSDKRKAVEGPVSYFDDASSKPKRQVPANLFEEDVLYIRAIVAKDPEKLSMNVVLRAFVRYAVEAHRKGRLK